MTLLKFSSHAWLEYIHWQKTDQSMKRLIDELCLSIKETPYEGLGYPQPLCYELKDVWSRRINFEHRLVYRIKGDVVQILQCKMNY
ncbi:Txe/YoeB family addiction module toxin [Reichenbachiella sp. MSK19-1]|uniref:Txe/YoeB family addiction module toxin n=1 Tax=Reichenbachiella sp. MSK19-1 TaxID=1897631 RepID=UPI000E6CE01A|nr:Txe/YoeB family addiction module toxin [Reichenbachiella sp. MSK19-1]RJE75099.1 toxin YoeB [Reichenbachiella sp. MSK19-1]